MNQPIKFPEMRPRHPPRDIVPPPPSSYLRRIPEFPTTDSGPEAMRLRRKRLYVWLAVAVALHLALFVGIWLTPTLRIKWEPSPDAWVQITSLPKESAPPPAPAGPRH